MPLIKQIAHVCIHAEDLKATEDFYINGLGLKKGFSFEKDGNPFGYYIQLGNQTFIEVFQGNTNTSGNIHHLALEVDDIDAVIQRLIENDYTVGSKKLGPDNSWQAWTEDPNGIQIEFHQYTNESMQLKGGTCPVDW